MKLLTNRTERLNPSILIFVGMFFGGLGQFVYVFFPLSSLSPDDGSTFAVWQNISFGVGLAITSPVAAVVFAMAAEKDLGDDSKLAEAIRAFVTVSLAIFVVVSVVSGVLLEESVDQQFLTALLLLASLFTQLVASIQRTLLASQSRWGKLCLHLTVDGVAKATLTFVVINLFIDPYVLMVIGVTASLIAVVVTHQKLPLRGGEQFLCLEVRNLKRFFSALSAAFGVQIFASGPPVFAEISNWSTTSIYSLALSAQVLRTGITLSTPLLVPLITDYASSLRKKDNSLISVSRRTSEQKLFAFSTMWFVGLAFAIIVYRLQNVVTLEALEYLNLKILAVISAVQLMLILSDFYQQLSLQGREERSSLVFWWVAIGLVISSWTVAGASVTLMYALSASVLSVLAVALRVRVGKPFEVETKKK